MGLRCTVLPVREPLLRATSSARIYDMAQVKSAASRLQFNFCEYFPFCTFFSSSCVPVLLSQPDLFVSRLFNEYSLSGQSQN